MTIHGFYRLAVWLPLALPAAVAVLVHGFDVDPGAGATSKIVQILLMSLLYGGPVYGPLALWATWWIGRRTEAQIRTLMVRAPLLMIAVFVPVALLTGLAAGAPGPFAAVAGLGAIVILAIGYGYVAFVSLLRAGLPAARA